MTFDPSTCTHRLIIGGICQYCGRKIEIPPATVHRHTSDLRSVEIELELESEWAPPEFTIPPERVRISIGSTREDGGPWRPPYVEIQPFYRMGPKRWPKIRAAVDAAFEEYARRFAEDP
jgi:hypothetical protein